LGAADMGIGLLPAFTNPDQQGRQKDRQCHYPRHRREGPKLIWFDWFADSGFLVRSQV